MHTLIRNIGFREGLFVEMPCLFGSMLIAELFYKFHSFTLECVAFLATWFAISYISSLVRNAWPRMSQVD